MRTCIAKLSVTPHHTDLPEPSGGARHLHDGRTVLSEVTIVRFMNHTRADDLYWEEEEMSKKNNVEGNAVIEK